MAASLLNLAQIKGGLALQGDVNALKTSYAAAKVITSIVKTPASVEPEAPAVYYNADELLGTIKTTLDSIAGEGSDSLAALRESITALAEKKVKDAVRVELTATYNDSTETFTISGEPIANIATIAPAFTGQNLTALPVYTSDNKVVYDTSGNQLTYSFTSNTFSGTPAMLDLTASKAASSSSTAVKDNSLVFTAFEDTFTFKVFPVGQFELGSIPDAALLDNSEMDLLTYDRIINKIIVELATDDDVVAAISEKVGAETVANQITAITDALASRVTALENGKIDKSSITTSKNVITIEADGFGDVAEPVAGAIYFDGTNYKTYDSENSEWVAATAADTVEIPGVATASDTKVVSEKVLAKRFQAVEDSITALESTTASTFVELEDVIRTDAVGAGAITGIRAAGSASDDKVASEKAIATALADKVNNSQIVTTIAATSSALDTNVPSEQAVAEALEAQETADATARAAIQSALQNLADRVTAVEGLSIAVDDKITVTGTTASPQTSFTLSQTPSAELVTALINGVVYIENDHFTVNRSTKAVTWTFTAAADGFDITEDISDNVRFRYHTGALVNAAGTVKVLHADSAPVAGTYAVGDMVFKINTTAGGPVGWICTAAGTPGTWTEFGVVNFADTISVDEEQTAP